MPVYSSLTLCEGEGLTLRPML